MTSKGKYGITFVMISFTLMFSFLSCDISEKYPSMKIVNKYENKTITSVTLVSYEFNGLSISYDASQTFLLDKGMPGGYKNINISVSYRSGSATWHISHYFDFNDGETTTITLKGSDMEGHPDYNNIRLE